MTTTNEGEEVRMSHSISTRQDFRSWLADSGFSEDMGLPADRSGVGGTLWPDGTIIRAGGPSGSVTVPPPPGREGLLLRQKWWAFELEQTAGEYLALKQLGAPAP